MTRKDFDEICLLVCPHCQLGLKLKQRPDTHEWQHAKPGMYTICWANGFRNSRFAENLTDG